MRVQHLPEHSFHRSCATELRHRARLAEVPPRRTRGEPGRAGGPRMISAYGIDEQSSLLPRDQCPFARRFSYRIRTQEMGYLTQDPWGFSHRAVFLMARFLLQG